MILKKEDDSFVGRNILITGASRGIAAEIAIGLAKKKANVMLNYCAEADKRAGQENAIFELEEKIKELGVRVEIFEQNLMDYNAGYTLMDKVLNVTPDLDSIVLSASMQINKTFLDQDTADINRQFSVNLTSNIQMLQKLIPILMEKEYGRILTIGSIQEVSPSANMPIYSLTKSALKNLVENLSIQLASYGVTVNNLSPGLIETDRNEHRRKNIDDWNSLVSSANPMRRAGVPDELIGAALFFLSDQSKFITGTTIYATGGAHIPQPLSDGNKILVNNK